MEVKERYDLPLKTINDIAKYAAEEFDDYIMQLCRCWVVIIAQIYEGEEFDNIIALDDDTEWARIARESISFESYQVLLLALNYYNARRG